MKGKDVIADFKFIGNRVSALNLETRSVEIAKQKVNVSWEFDYNTLDIQRDERYIYGIIEFVANIKAKIKNKILFKIDLVMEGAFSTENKFMDEEVFIEFLELNGLVALSQISRGFIISVTSQAGINPPVKMPMLNIKRLRDMKEQK